MKFNYSKFSNYYKNFNDVQLSNKICISRSQFWRAKKGNNVGEKFMSNFKKAFPELNIDDYFFS